MIDLIDLLIVLGVFSLVGLHVAAMRFLLRRGSESEPSPRTAERSVQAAAPTRGSEIPAGDHSLPVPVA